MEKNNIQTRVKHTQEQTRSEGSESIYIGSADEGVQVMVVYEDGEMTREVSAGNVAKEPKGTSASHLEGNEVTPNATREADLVLLRNRLSSGQPCLNTEPLNAFFKKIVSKSDCNEAETNSNPRVETGILESRTQLSAMNPHIEGR
ncbi:hypothetical protein DPX16_23749 [Anabarilius grahami]|uniref:Uncharacterized protein n=1 Tax=Anabarilius grahami TaxID=495550 RepID=A0A3N0YHI2_ANAGA|nr:hypothetical protein DPX16_23749 [Anabarilius grahami]